MTARLEASPELLAAVIIADADGVSIDSVLARGREDLIARLAYREIVAQKVRAARGS